MSEIRRYHSRAENLPCEKCRNGAEFGNSSHETHTIKYVSPFAYITGYGAGYTRSDHEECLTVQCNKCGHTYKMRTADYKEPAQEIIDDQGLPV